MRGGTPFGPFYPPRLQSVVNHAERLSELLAKKLRGTPRGAAHAWLVGRGDEIACFVEHVAREWSSGALAETAAAKALAEYLDALHVGLGKQLRIASPACCTGDQVTTVDVDPAELLAGLDADAKEGRT